jgi:hypothetical protein
VTDLINEQTDAGAEVNISPQTLELLKSLGFDHVPTVEEIEEAWAKRREEVRQEVLFHADRRSWCESGTRQVCANLRVARPGDREEHTITARVSYDVELTVASYTKKGAIAVASYNQWLPTARHNGRTRTVTNIKMDGLTIDGESFEMTDELLKEVGYE